DGGRASERNGRVRQRQERDDFLESGSLTTTVSAVSAAHLWCGAEAGIVRGRLHEHYARGREQRHLCDRAAVFSFEDVFHLSLIPIPVGLSRTGRNDRRGASGRPAKLRAVQRSHRSGVGRRAMAATSPGGYGRTEAELTPPRAPRRRAPSPGRPPRTACAGSP